MSTSVAKRVKKTANSQNKLPSILKRPIASQEDYEMRVGPGWTLSDGTYEHVPQSKRRKRDVPYPAYVDLAHESMFGLSSLQLGYNAPITHCAMDIATEHVWKCLPKGVQELIEVAPPNGPELWSNNARDVDEMYQRMREDSALKNQSTYKYYSLLKRKPWTVWPIWVEDDYGFDWVVIVWYSEESQASSGVYDRVRTYEVYDPRRDMGHPEGAQDGKKRDIIQDRSERIRDRWLDFLSKGGFDTRNVRRSSARMCPMVSDDYTSGERCFAAVKDILGSIRDNYIDGVTFNPDRDSLPSLSRWVNPYGSRIEMAGINAWVLMSTFSYNARIVVECIEPEMKTDIVVDGQRRTIKPFELAGPRYPPLIAAADYCVDPQVESPSK
ncbi:uncharacterized protein F4807DRAFT_436481 [Annulohypoxylon truncatum]|uniref:uncharacterized protein n=1 Tax=Annulohypoxylon truncatum TaxID=327061 RepID=UPI002008906B|nr:uncharacterized protein F4807DRAFT_436481 [Annulohypoxylon truncatum]KAI1206956.1 hypothetical protein F4807DRAFT_436481 [Annulohypoxylon truncatum]